ncbi:transglycosylase SLT domain-containing protein [Streptantibioticus parmotrematis]|uniref:transglycosylase SLT domain-containing protein n=1 Tax=Streptantibioticus parmotrematis TaxID=2873249 RepID=UPI0033FEFC28
MPIPAAFNRLTRTYQNSTARMTRKQKLSAAGVAVAGASVLAFTVVPASAHAANPSNPVMGVAMAWNGSGHTGDGKHIQPNVADGLAVTGKQSGNNDLPKSGAAQKKADDAKAAADQAARGKAAKAAKDQAAKERKDDKPAANRSEQRQPVAAAPAAPQYANNLNGWINHALAIMHQHNIPGSYEGIHRNVMRESSGNPNAINNWDINAQNGIPSKGLLQVIQPTFEEYHISGTANNLYDPVANIVAACNYAAHRYGTIDNVNSAY